MPTSTQPALTQTPMGKIVTTLTVTNHRDQIAVERSALAPEGVRSVTLDNVLVDSGATTPCLPADVIARLGLAVRREVPIAPAMGLGTARLFQNAAITLMGREGTFDCLELPAGTTPLLGVVPLEALGIEARRPGMKAFTVELPRALRARLTPRRRPPCRTGARAPRRGP